MLKIHRDQVLATLRTMVEADFDPECSGLNPFCPSCVAKQGLRNLEAAYEDLEVEEIADEVLTSRDDGDLHSDNLVIP